MEQPPSPERKIEKAEVIEKLKETGLENPETFELVIKWTEQREQEITTSREGILLNAERAELYLAAGDRPGAIEALEDALLQAQQENETELCAQIQNKLAQIENT